MRRTHRPFTVPALGRPLRRLNPHFNTRTAAGNTLADLVLGIARPPSGQTLASLRKGQLTWPEVSELARGDGVAQALWDDSGRLVGLPSG